MLLELFGLILPKQRVTHESVRHYPSHEATAQELVSVRPAALAVMRVALDLRRGVFGTSRNDLIGRAVVGRLRQGLLSPGPRC